MDKSWFVETLLDWYAKHQRDLPWRKTKDPYKIWLSEIILQQTRVQQGLPYYERFAQAFPQVADLAQADEAQVLRLWQGLGYYSRARNMHFAAKQVMNDFGGQFPKAYQDVLTLKGVGTYTAAAIASFSSDEAVAVLDGNVFRVLSRLFAIEEDILSTEGKKTFQALADGLVPDLQAGDYNQAMMEFGAMHCKPANPDCMFCVLAVACQGRAKGMVSRLPVKVKKLKIKERYLHYLVFRDKEGMVMKERTGKGIWQGLYDFPVIESKKDFLTPADLAEQTAKYTGVDRLRLPEEWVEKTHILTHQRLKARFYEINLDDKVLLLLQQHQEGFKFYQNEKIEELPKPTLIVNYIFEKQCY